MKHNRVLFVVALALLQFALSSNTCPYAYAPDGTRYDLSNVANQVQQYSHYSDGMKINYNMTVCFAWTNTEACSTCPGGSAGVCQYWGPYPITRRCLGLDETRDMIGLNKGAGVQITYRLGAYCRLCTPPDNLTSVITLTCDQQAKNNVIKWTSVVIAQPFQPPVNYFNGTMYCNVQPSKPKHY